MEKKRFLSLLLLLLTCMSIHAQDVIVKTDGSTILSKVIEITDTQIRYKKHNNQKGPTYNVAKSDVKCINYANGTRDEFVKEEPVQQPFVPEVTNPITLSSGQQTVSDAELYEMANGGVSLENEYYLKKAKKQKIIGWIGGACFVALGAASFIYTDAVRWRLDECYTLGGVCLGAGVAWTSTWLLIAHHTKKNALLDMVQSIPVLQQEFPLGNGHSFLAGIDAIRDTVQQQQTFGLGLRYQF